MGTVFWEWKFNTWGQRTLESGHQKACHHQRVVLKKLYRKMIQNDLLTCLTDDLIHTIPDVLASRNLVLNLVQNPSFSHFSMHLYMRRNFTPWVWVSKVGLQPIFIATVALVFSCLLGMVWVTDGSFYGFTFDASWSIERDISEHLKEFLFFLLLFLVFLVT